MKMYRFVIVLLAVGACVAGDHVVGQKDREFSAPAITVKLGDTVTFQNSDTVAHNVFSATPGMEFDIRRQAPGGASTVPFPKEGISEVRCSIHPKMKMLVTVKK